MRCWVNAAREHEDLDILLVLGEHARAWRLLHEDGYRLAHTWEENVFLPGDLVDGSGQPTAYVLEDQWAGGSISTCSMTTPRITARSGPLIAASPPARSMLRA